MSFPKSNLCVSDGKKESHYIFHDDLSKELRAPRIDTQASAMELRLKLNSQLAGG